MSKPNGLTDEQHAVLKQEDDENRAVRRLVRQLAALPRAKQDRAIELLGALRAHADDPSRA